MKRKYYALIAAAILLASISLAILYTRIVAGKANEEIRITGVRSFPTIDVPGPVTIEEMGRLGERVGELSQPEVSYADDLNLSLFGYHVIKEGGEGVASGPETSYSITMAFAAGKSHYSVIDGSFYAEGGVLPDGGKVALIEMDKVLIVRQGLSILVPLKEKRWMSNK